VGGEVLVNEFDGLGVVAAVAAKRAAESVVELVDVGGVESAVVGDVRLEFERHLLHEPERVSARGLRGPNVMAVKLRERVGWWSFRSQRGLDCFHDVVAQRMQIRDTDAGPEHGEQRAGVGEQETLLPLDPEEV
jgi:hypothetical protein